MLKKLIIFNYTKGLQKNLKRNKENDSFLKNKHYFFTGVIIFNKILMIILVVLTTFLCKIKKPMMNQIEENF